MHTLAHVAGQSSVIREARLKPGGGASQSSTSAQSSDSSTSAALYSIGRWSTFGGSVARAAVDKTAGSDDLPPPPPRPHLPPPLHKAPGQFRVRLRASRYGSVCVEGSSYSEGVAGLTRNGDQRDLITRERRLRQQNHAVTTARRHHERGELSGCVLRARARRRPHLSVYRWRKYLTS